MADVSALSPPTAAAVGPGSVALDIVVRALKTAVTTFLGIMGVTGVTEWNVSSIRAAGFAAASAAATVVLNVVLSWANSD